MEFVILTGLSGAGKTRAMHAMEDIGFYCVDNLPPALIPVFYDLCDKSEGIQRRVAVVTDTRGGELFKSFFSALETLKAQNEPYKILFMDASEPVLVNRFQETRRKHPLSEAMQGSLEQAVRLEREMLRPVKEISDYVIDTSNIPAAGLKARISDLFLQNDNDAITVHCISFGFKYGLPLESDLVFDVRCLPNPFYVEELREHTGLEAPVRDYVMNCKETEGFKARFTDMIDYMLPLYIQEGKSRRASPLRGACAVYARSPCRKRHSRHGLAPGYHETIKREGAVFMSFAADCKQELCMIENKRACCLKAECYGLLLFSKCFSARESQMVCENAAVARRVAEAAAVSAGVYAEVRSQLRRKNIGAYAITIPGEAARIQMIRSFGHDENDVNLHIHEENLQKDCCISAFLRGVFLICGTVTDPQKEYHLEFSTPYLHLAEDLVGVLHRVKAAQLSPSIARRKNSYIVYIKESAAIEDFLTLTGAVNSAMNLMQIKMYKETYNNLNRVSNCETANLDKTYSAATKQIAAIALISDKVGLDELPADLREAAVLRLENPEMSLREMGERLSISRSGVNHRLRRILEFAEQLGSPEESLAEQSVFEVEEKLHAENAKTEEL